MIKLGQTDKKGTNTRQEIGVPTTVSTSLRIIMLFANDGSEQLGPAKSQSFADRYSIPFTGLCFPFRP